jgi:lipopolysaccharide heptosyltransferase I
MITPQAFSKILIIKLSSLGDIIHTLPSMELLRKTYPLARIDWLVEEGFHEILKYNPLVDRIYLLRFRSPLRKNKWRIFYNSFKQIRKEKYDIAIDFQGLIKSSFFSSLSGATYKVGFSEHDLREKHARYFYNATPHHSYEGGHIIAKNINLLSIFNIYNGNSNSPKIFISEQDDITVKEELRKRDLTHYYLLHPWAGWKTKQWNLKNFVQVIDRFYEKTKQIALITWAPNEYAKALQFMKMCTKGAQLSFPTTIGKLAALINHSTLVIGGDTGPIHLADALQKPLLSIYGPTKPSRTGPINPHARTIYHQLECSGCKKRNCPYHHTNCMKTITVDEVYENLVELYDKANASDS